ncbi:MAG: hypothetical protein JSV91_11720 [Phycisphaerales bacterium]|nr:MAG: hypothetical protein JSV91_11720 [Phycisphaerales bacterium]
MQRLLCLSLAALIWATALTVTTGCAWRGRTGSLRIRSLGEDPVTLAFRAVEACYAHDPAGGTSFWLTDVPAEDLRDGKVAYGQVVHVELLWLPKPGKTPMDRTATNASIRWVIASEGEVGVYGGAGFVMPHGSPGADSLRLTIHEASLTLQEKTPGFCDLLTPAEMTGDFTVSLDPRRARKLRLTISQFVTDALGRSRFVHLPPVHTGADDPQHNTS